MSVTSRTLACFALTLACTGAAYAADRTVMMPVKEAIDAATAAGKLDGSVKFYFDGTGPRGKVIEANVVTNQKSNAFGKSDEKACLWVGQSALIAMQEAAKRTGANAVINIVSYYKKVENRNAANYECHAGAIIAGVALRGDLALVK